MNRSDLITVLAARFPNLTAKDVEVSAKELFDGIGRIRTVVGLRRISS